MKSRNAFTLLEILISVVVLAIGLVGVVAIFPAVIDLQRRAQDSVIGTAAATSAEAQLVGTFVENRSLDWFDWEGEFGRNITRDEMFPAFSVLRYDQGISERDPRNLVGAASKVYSFQWETNWDWSRPENTDAIDTLLATGDLILGGGRSYRADIAARNNNVLPELTIDIGQRLLPDAASRADPRYVYDFVVRRVDTGIGLVPRGNVRTYEKLILGSRLDEVPLEMAVFVRRVDRNIRVPLGVSIREALTGVSDDPDNDDAVTERRFPLAVSGNDFCKIVPNGKPTTANTVYSIPVAAYLRPESLLQSDPQSGVWDLFDPGSLRMTGSGATLESAQLALTQVGQLVIDSTGTVRRVSGIQTKQIRGADRQVLVMDPPFASNSTDVYRQIVFTPQVPVGIRVLNIR